MHRLLLAGLLAGLALPAAAQPALRTAGPPVAVTRAGDGPFTGPLWSPDGSLLAFSSAGYGGIWIAGPDGSGLRRVTDADGAGFGFSWSPDGSALLARVAREEADRRRSHAVMVFDVVDGRSTALTEFRPEMPSLPIWAPGTADVVLPTPAGLERLDAGLPPAARRSGAAERFVALRDGRPVVGNASARTAEPLDRFADETLLNLVTSPDGRRVAFEVLGGNAWVLDPASGRAIDLGRGYRPQWSPDGRWIVYMVTEDDGERYLSSELVAVRSDGSARVQLTDTPDRQEMNPSWSPDGTRLAFDDILDGVVYVLPIAE
jgi:dipeptidyl aminopeptidase/acylaminoacyl peptidase